MSVVITLSSADVESLKTGGIIPITIRAELNDTGTAYDVISTKTSSAVSTDNVGTIIA